MASAAITIVENPATIETDGTAAVITKSTGLTNMEGTLVNAGLVDTWLKINGTGVVTTNAQAQNIVPLPAGASMPWLKSYATIEHKTAGAVGVLAWFPDKAKSY